MLQRGISVVTYNRANHLEEVLDSILSTSNGIDRIVVCDDGSTDNTIDVVKKFKDVIYYRGPNLGVGANKNRALYLLQECAFICILEDDLVPQQLDWFQAYEQLTLLTGIHHFCRVQDKEIPETISTFSTSLINKGVTPIYGESPRGDLTFISNKVIQKVGGLNAKFKGVGYAHGEWSHRVVKAGLVPHPNRWIDFKEIRDSFKQLGDTEGGRWNEDKKKIKEQIKYNRAIQKQLKLIDYLYHPLVLS